MVSKCKYKAITIPTSGVQKLMCADNRLSNISKTRGLVALLGRIRQTWRSQQPLFIPIYVVSCVSSMTALEGAHRRARHSSVIKSACRPLECHRRDPIVDHRNKSSPEMQKTPLSRCATGGGSGKLGHKTRPEKQAPEREERNDGERRENRSLGACFLNGLYRASS